LITIGSARGARGLSFVSVQKSYPAHGQGYGTEILLHLALEDIGAHLIQHVAELIIYFGKEHGVIKAGSILKGEAFQAREKVSINYLQR